MAWIHDSDGLYANSPYSPSPQNPSYGSNNPYGYSHSPVPTPAPTVVGVPQPFSNSLAQNSGGYSVTSAINTQSIADAIKIAAPAKPLGMISFKNGDIKLEFNTAENGQDVKLEFCPERDITVRELMNINMLIAALTNGISMFTEDPMLYVRKHNLERHFKFTV